MASCFISICRVLAVLAGSVAAWRQDAEDVEMRIDGLVSGGVFDVVTMLDGPEEPEVSSFVGLDIINVTLPGGPTHPPEYLAEFLSGECEGGQVLRTTCQTLQANAYERIRDSILVLVESLNESCTAVHCERGDFAGCVLRLVGHDLMDFDPETAEGGSDACIDFEDDDNKGLKECLTGAGEFGKGSTVQEAYAQFCHEISLADFLVAAGEAIMTLRRPDWDPILMKSPSLQFDFKFGRETAVTCNPVSLPNVSRSCQAVEDTFVTNLGLNWTESAALMGVHTLGRAAVNNSGFDGWWTSGMDGGRFDHIYFVNLLGAGWVPAQVQGSGKFQWVRSDGGPETEIMLNTDLCLLWNTDHGCMAESEGDQNCCLWASEYGLDGAPSVCVGGDSFEHCCRGNATERCGNFHVAPSGASPAGDESARAIIDFAKDESYWLAVFKIAWAKVTETNGNDELFSDCVDTPPASA